MAVQIVPGLDLRAHGAAAAWVQAAALATVGNLEVDGARPQVYAEHAGEPGYRAVGAWLGQDLVGFAYGHDARPGQWWREQVAPALAQVGLAGWLDDAYVLVELHLLPAHHGQGLGQALLAGLVGPVTRRRLLLSTDDLDTRARRFYRRNGCLDLLTGFRFSTTRRPFAIMGGLLPLAGPDAGAARYPRG